MNQPEIYPHMVDLIKRRIPFAVCSIVRSSGSTPRHVGSKMLVQLDRSIYGTVGGGELENRVIGEALDCIASGKPKLLAYKMNDLASGDPGVCGGQLEIFVEPMLPSPKVVVVGTGHVGKQVVKLAKWLGFYVVASDDRAEFCTAEAIPDADEYVCCPLADLPEHLILDKQTYLLLTTRGVKIDVPGLPAIFDADPGYIGIIGSKRRWLTTKEELISQGYDKNKIAKVHSPIGFDIGAETPEEIAISIMAEILMHRNKRTGELMNINSQME